MPIFAAARISSIGFNFSGALCLVLVVRGFRSAEGQPDLNLKTLVTGALIGMVIAAPVFWRFTQALVV